MNQTKNLKTFILSAVLVIAGLLPLQAQKQIGASEGLTKKARDHLNLFQYDQALTLLKQAIEIEPDNWEPWFLAGRAYLKMKNEAEAEKFLVKAHQLNSSEIEVQKALGALYIFYAKAAQGKGQTAEMGEFLHKACRAYPGGTKIWQSLLEQWWKAGEYEKIKAEGDFIVKSNPLALEQGDDKSLQTALVIVAKTYYRDGDFVATENFLKQAGMIRQQNDEMYTLKRELKNKAEENVRKLVDQASQHSAKGEYDKALELLQNASKMPGSKPSEILEMMDRIEKEASLKKSLAEIDALISSSKHEEALEKLHEAAQQFPENKELSEKLESVTAVVEKKQAAEAKANAAVIAEKKRKLEFSRQLALFIKDGEENEQKKNYDVAILSFEKAIKMSPENGDLVKKVAELKELSKKARERQDAFSTRFTEFESLFSSENYSECHDKGKALLEEYPENKKSVSVILAEASLKLGKFAEAKEAVINLEGDSEHETLYHYVSGMVAYQQGDNDLALEHLKKVSAKNSGFRGDVTSTIYLIYLYQMQMGIYILLLAAAFPMIKFGREALANWKVRSMINKLEKIKETGDYAAHLAFLEERLEKEDVPNPKQVSVMLAEALLRTGNPQRAYDLVNALLKKDSRNPLGRRIAGEAALLLEDTTPTGLDHVQNLLKIDETRKDVISYLARVYIKQQADHKMAQDFILKAISINPSDTEAVVFLADTYIKRQTYNQQTQKIFERAIKIAPEVPEYYIAIIENFHRLENHQEAEKWRETAASRFPAQEDFMAERPRTTPGRSGLRLKSENTPAAPGAFPDYDSIGKEANPAPPAGGFPDYESIGNNAAPTPAAGGFPDYDSIGEEPAEDLLPPRKPTAPPAPAPAVITGPQKNCPHCNAINSLKEYYCNTCGKPC